ncbi:hypothetical protein [Bacillus salacetis]|nr:hypothetical protein [Bacillus salacetis]
MWKRSIIQHETVDDVRKALRMVHHSIKGWPKDDGNIKRLIPDRE